MSEPFDPYHKWLGIPVEDQPPHHYRLLGVDVFESDPDVIENAATRQMLLVRTFQSGRYGPLSQKLLNELSAARICLLNDEKKRGYDDQLRSRLRAEEVAQQPATPAPPVPPASRRAAPAAAPSNAGRVADAPLAASAAPPALPPQLPAKAAPTVPVGTATPPVANAAPVVVVGEKSPVASVQVRGARSGSRAATNRVRARRSSPIPVVLAMVGLILVAGLGVIAVYYATRPGTGGNNEPRVPERTAWGGASNPVPQRSPRRPTPRKPPTRPGPATAASDPGPSPTQDASRAKQFRQAVAAARQAFAERDLDEAKRQLIEANLNHEGAQQKQEFERLTALRDYLVSFRAQMREGVFYKLEPEESFEYQGKQFKLLSREGEVVTFSVDGKKTSSPVAQLKIDHALAFARRVTGDDDPYAKIQAAAFLLFDQHDASAKASRRAEAERLWRESAESLGRADPFLAAELQLDPNSLGLPPPNDGADARNADGQHLVALWRRP